MIVCMVEENLSSGSNSESVATGLLNISKTELERISAENETQRGIYHAEILKSSGEIASERQAEIAAQSLSEYDEIFGEE